ncbi:hypothetical protein COU59_02515 [Candidatus Pacearchaeota archaeon CG10_big_fil_rev_8_21_14_0_10_34_12]|nr:MAG: hypothetical protein COU59_02515 [Candidatus Pacearchaeota archaeon CG10_big_fil_rev_8_21_14_0_10_34_12]
MWNPFKKSGDENANQGDESTPPAQTGKPGHLNQNYNNNSIPNNNFKQSQQPNPNSQSNLPNQDRYPPQPSQPSQTMEGEKPPRNWPMIILIALGVFIVLSIIGFFLFSLGGNGGDDSNSGANSNNDNSENNNGGTTSISNETSGASADTENITVIENESVNETNDNSSSVNESQTQPVGSGLYNCDTDTYNCEDFANKTAAQAAFDYCSDLGFGDIHQLDNDSDGFACESLS